MKTVEISSKKKYVFRTRPLLSTHPLVRTLTRHPKGKYTIVAEKKDGSLMLCGYSDFIPSIDG